MLRTLHIENYVLIDSLDISFPESLVIITGQTGAGKSILLGALSLLTGAKADAGVIGNSAENCVVEAEFSVPDNPELEKIFNENDICTDNGIILIRRVVNRSGRSRCFVNDCPVQASVLPLLAAHLIDIHSQHNSLLLSSRRFQMNLLDNFAGNGVLLKECSEIWKDLLKSRKELESAREKLQRASLESDYNDAILEKLRLANLKEGELEALEEEHKQLSNAEAIKDNLSGASSLLESGDLSVAGNIKEAARLLEKTAGFIPSVGELASRLEEARIELEDISSEIEVIAEKTVLSEDRLQAVEERMSELYGLLRKHDCQTIADLIRLRDSLEEECSSSNELEYRIGELEKEVEAKSKAHLDICAGLHRNREAAAPELSSKIQSSLRFLELDRSVFIAELSESEPSENGSDGICFKFSASGASPVDVAKCASGGELSRIMLSLKQMMSQYVGMPTMIFDEIDTGVSGSVADKMGSMICTMGSSMQVIAITHLPQVAAKGDAHFIVSKTIAEDGTAYSQLHKVEGEKRVEEIARLLSGARITPQAIENAKVLLAGN